MYKMDKFVYFNFKAVKHQNGGTKTHKIDR